MQKFNLNCVEDSRKIIIEKMIWVKTKSGSKK